MQWGFFLLSRNLYLSKMMATRETKMGFHYHDRLIFIRSSQINCTFFFFVCLNKQKNFNMENENVDIVPKEEEEYEVEKIMAHKIVRIKSAKVS